MTALADTLTTPNSGRRSVEDRLAAPMFALSVLFLIVLAGLIHRYPHPSTTAIEMYLIEGGLCVLWLVFIAEAVLRFHLRDRRRPAWGPLASAAACVVVPPMRLGCRSRARPNHIWLPGLGWREINSHLRRTLERAFSVPMILFALMVVPLLALDYYYGPDNIRDNMPVLALWLAIGTAVIWLAFAVELVVMVSVSDRPWRYCFLHWIDVAIVVLPAIEVLPLFRLARLGRLLRLEQALRWGRLHRLQALVMRGWRAFLLLQIIQRLTGHSLERRRKQLLDLVRAKEEEMGDLRREIRELEVQIARNAAAGKKAVSLSPGPEADGEATELDVTGLS
jgi:voltage-gated potassium channel